MRPAYDVVLATGGIGSGIFMALEGDHTLGREESRAARLLDLRDYCKLHIVCHYLGRLLSPSVPVYPIGRVGHDPAGRALLEEMRAAGLDTTFVGSSAEPTLFSVCFTYPGGDGGNLTTTVSASSEVSAEDVSRARALFEGHEGTGMALALPEVPLDARIRLLELATRHRFHRVATLLTGEVQAARDRGLLAMVDLLCLNIDEAAALAPGVSSADPPARVVEALIDRLGGEHPEMSLVVTAGSRGSWSWDGGTLVHAPVPPTHVVGTAGAGDAHLAGVVAALVAGATLHESNHFAALVSAVKVMSGHAINPDVDRAYLAEAAAARDHRLAPAITQLLHPSGTSPVASET